MFFTLRRTLALTRSAVSQRGRTPLHLATERGHTEVVKMLVEAGATVQATDEVSALPGGLRE